MFKLFTIFDRESKTYDRPFSAPTERDAKAGFAAAINNKETNFGQFPQDYDLHVLCEFDPRTGDIFNIKNDLIATGNSLLKDSSHE